MFVNKNFDSWVSKKVKVTNKHMLKVIKQEEVRFLARINHDLLLIKNGISKEN